ncbi:hypothetical protein DH2020_035568 [Rehmannia glutinosa]|uniref:Thioredoxin domain-containing protein n=1 Tax=Rehmannia glutinosa TaxID=99300 RepID=A0ABR0V907_REHGL
MAETEIGCGFMGSFLGLIRPRNVVLFDQDTPHTKKQPHSSKSAVSSSARRRQNPPTIPIPAKKTTYTMKEPTFNSSELSLTLTDQRKLDPTGTLYRATAGNVMLLGHLGNLKQQQQGKGKSSKADPKCGNVNKNPPQLGNILHNPINPINRFNADAVKSLGNEKYKQGKYEEAVALYDRAISIDPNKACYYSNKSAALIGLGRFVEAVSQCREAIRIDSSYHNAHFRIANLYLRLGVVEEAVIHYRCSGRKAGPEDDARAKNIKNCLDRCIEAQNHGDWRKLLDESQIAVSLGADAAPQVYAMKAEALMKLHRHQEAYTVLQNAPHFSTELYAEFLGSTATAGLLQVRALVYMANGRFEEAVSAVEQALRLDPSNSSMKLTAERIKSVALARLNGNRLFKGSRFSEALIAYNKGLEIDPYNSVLLCNRAACRSKLGQYEKAVEDCTAALLLEKWEAAIEDYEVLMQEIPGDEEVNSALLEAKIQLNKLQNGHNMDTDTISNLSSVSSNKHFTYFTTTPGLSVVLFCSKMCSKKMLQLLEEVCLKFPSVNFLKVDIEDNPRIAKSEGVKVIPTFRVYRNGSKVKEIGDNVDKLESCVKLYCS